jgi:lipoprotein NlpD
MRHTFILLLAVGLAACGGSPVVPVDQHTTVTVAQETESIGGRLVRIVQAGDTLYSIAFEAGLDYRELAAWNGVGDPYLVDIGQKLRLTRPLNMPSVATRPVITDSRPVAVSPRSSSPPPAVRSTPPVSTRAPPQTTEQFPGRISQWAWPATGAIFRGFGPNLGRKGIDIVGQSGQNISASAGGKIVYAGNGLRGYGNLIIVKHNDEFLSAYAHNRKIFVREGEWVKRGQKIAEMGDSGAERVMLHFEIRRTGKPVDPRAYLPRGGNKG